MKSNSEKLRELLDDCDKSARFVLSDLEDIRMDFEDGFCGDFDDIIKEIDTLKSRVEKAKELEEKMKRKGKLK